MRSFFSFLTVLAMLLQVITPAVGCGIGLDCCCSRVVETNAQVAQDQLASCCASKQVAEPKRSCCNRNQPAECEVHSNSLGSETQSGCSCCQDDGLLPAPLLAGSNTVELELKSLLELSDGSVNTLAVVISPTPAQAWSRVQPDDLTRPHRQSRCHLLDCVWLI